MFVSDPKLKAPFTVLNGTNIRCLESKKYINSHYLNNKRRLKKYDLAFTNLFTYPCRIFAKSEKTVTPLKLHKVADGLNEKFAMLLACKVDVETAYQQLVESSPKKVKDGIAYETGELEQPDTAPLQDTPSSYSEASDDNQLDNSQSQINSEHDRVRIFVIVIVIYN